MRRQALLSIFALLALSAFAQTDSTATTTTTDAAAAPADASATATADAAAQAAPAPDASAATAAAMAAIASVQAQQQLSGKYATLLLDYQSASGWLQVAQNWLALAKSNSRDLEQDLEEDDDEDFVPLGTFGAQLTPSNNDGRAIEKAAEHALLGVLKLMYLQAGQKLHAAHQSHYQTKIQLLLLQSNPAAASSMGSVMYLMYYVETLRLLSSAVTIQRQDAWNQWLTLDMIESELTGPVSSKLDEALKKSRETAMQLYYTEASLDLQIFYLEYYLQMIAAQFAQSAAASAASAAAAAPPSFLEEMSTAEPNKPFVPFMMGMMGGAPYMSYYSMILKFWAVTMNVNAAQGLYLSAHPNANTNGNYPAQTMTYAVSALQQWAYIKLQQAMIDMYGLFAAMQGAPAMHNSAAAANSFVQTAPPLTSPENVQ